MSLPDARHDPRTKYLKKAAKRWLRYDEVLAEIVKLQRPPTPQETRALTRNRHAAQNAERVAASLTERLSLKCSA